MDTEHSRQEGVYNVPEVLDAKATRLRLEVRVRDSMSEHLVKICAEKVNLRALTAEEMEVLERPLRRYSGFMRGDAKASLTKEAMQLIIDGQMHLWGIEGRILVDRLIRTEKACILWLCQCAWTRRRRTAWPGLMAPSAWASRAE